MIPPIIQTIKIQHPYTLFVEFDNQEKKEYDVFLLFNKEMFAPLKNQVFFNTCKIDSKGYAVIWNENIDLSEYQLWKNGKPIT